MKIEFEIKMKNGQVVHLTEEQLINMIAKAVKKAIGEDEDSRLVIFSYDATLEFKEYYKKKYKQEFKLDEFWAEIDNLNSLEIHGKPVESTFVLEAKDSSCYQELVDLIEKKYESLPYVIGVVEKNDGEDLYEVYPNPASEDDDY